MSTFVDVLRSRKAPVWWFGAAFLTLLVVAALIIPSFQHSRFEPQSARVITQLQEPVYRPGTAAYSSPTLEAKSPAQPASDSAPAAAPAAKLDAAVARKIVRTGSMQIVVQHPSEAVDRITALTQSLGGYVQSADGGGDTATEATLTIRVPAAQFDRVRAEIRKLGLRVEGEKVDAEDVTQRYVDQDATLRNLRAEEAQYLTILKQAHTVKDMLAVSEQLSEVRGQIEQQQAEFNVLSQQIDTVALTIALHTEPPPQPMGFNWHPGREMRMAIRDGLESLANYATAMLAIIFFLPAVMLWTGTILLALFGGWKTLRWAGQRWFGWTVGKATQA
ncbi:MAG TPA: DUF4349 domain-containing protein [Candidatus Sulfotelmatobacter sp.]|nr:DUF4349 domain-containing protein [Candidatus Sulfotelmatobacter sp.]